MANVVMVGNKAKPLGGCHPRRTALGELFPVASVQPMPRSAWHPPDLKRFAWHIFDQNGYNSCAANMGIGVLQLIREIEGENRILLSPGFTYKQINGGVDRGAAIDDVLDTLSKVGAVPVDIFDVNDWRKSTPSNAKEVAANYRFTEWDDIPDIEILGTMLTLGFPIAIGVDWPGGGGHAIVVVNFRIANSSGVCEFEIQNSWGLDYGEQGFGWLEESRIAAGIRKYGAWTPRVSTLVGSRTNA